MRELQSEAYHSYKFSVTEHCIICIDYVEIIWRECNDDSGLKRNCNYTVAECSVICVDYLPRMS